MKAKPAKAPDRNAGNAISRMPRIVREAVSAALVDGADWRAVAKLCTAAGHPGVKAQNVTNYRQGAHKEWLAREERLEAIRRDSENTAAVVRHYTEHGGSPAEAGLLAAAEIMSASLATMGPEMMQALLATDPKALFGMVRELSRVAELLGKKAATAAATQVDTTPVGPVLSEDEQAAKIVAMVDAALGIKGK